MLTFYIVGIQVQQDSLENWEFNLLVIFLFQRERGFCISHLLNKPHL